MTQSASNSPTSSEANQITNFSGGAVDLAKDIKTLAGEAAGQSKKIAEAQFSGQKDRATKALGSVAKALRSSGEQLRSENAGDATQYVARAADGVDQLAGYLQSRNLSDLMHDAENFARREPALFLGGSFVAGLIASRFLKSSRPAGSGSGGSGSSRPDNQGGYGSSRRDGHTTSGSGGAIRARGDRVNGDDTARSTQPTGAPGTVPANRSNVGSPAGSRQVSSSSGAASGSSATGGPGLPSGASGSRATASGGQGRSQSKPQDKQEKV